MRYIAFLIAIGATFFLWTMGHMNSLEWNARYIVIALVSALIYFGNGVQRVANHLEDMDDDSLLDLTDDED